MNALERAVIEAARVWATDPHAPYVAVRLVQAVRALDTWEASQDPTTCTIEWHEVVEGDELKSVKNGRFYPVTSVLKVKGGYELTLAGVPKKITRPTEAEPDATVRRGPTGNAMDLLTQVLTSGGD